VNEKHVSSHDGWHLPGELHLKLSGKMAPDVTFVNWHQIAFTADMYTKSTFWCFLACKNLSCSMRVFINDMSKASCLLTKQIAINTRSFGFSFAGRGSGFC
jgi:hypothetical protein